MSPRAGPRNARLLARGHALMWGPRAREPAVAGVPPDRGAGDVAEVGADEREALVALHPLDLVEALDGLLVHEVAPEPVDGVRRVRDDAPLVQEVDGPLDFPGLRVFWVDRKKHAYLARKRFKSGLKRGSAAGRGPSGSLSWGRMYIADRGLARAIS